MVLSLLVLSAFAAPYEGVAVTPFVVTEVPVHVGVGVAVELPARLRTEVQIGVLPRAYVQLANAVITELYPDDYDENTAKLVEDSLSTSLVVRARFGWQPLPTAGWTFGAGLSVAALGGSSTGAALVEGFTGYSVPTRPTGNEAVIDATATLLLVDVATAWEIRLWKGLVLTPRLGWSFTVWANSDLEPAFEVRTPSAQQALDDLEVYGEQYLEDTFTGYVHPPFVGLSLGWRFGP